MRSIPRLLTIGAGMLLLAGVAISQKSNTPEAQLRAAMDKETVDGDLKAAIEQYKKVIAQKGASKEVVARALVRLGGAYEKQGSAEARQYYERVVREFSDQGQLAEIAQAHLSASSLSAGGKSRRTVWLSSDAPTYGRVSWDGRYLNFARDNKLWVKDLSTGEDRVVASSADGYGSWSQDGKHLAYNAKTDEGGYEIRVINLDGSGMRTLYRGPKGRGTWPEAWSPDGKRILSWVELDDDGYLHFFWLNAADGGIQALPMPKTQSDDMALSPDGRFLAFAYAPNDAPREVRLISADGKQQTTILPSSFNGSPLGWTADSKNVVVNTRANGDAGSLWLLPVADGKSQGAPVIVEKEFGSRNFGNFGMTRNNALFYSVRTTTSSIYTASMDAASGKVTSSPQPLPTSLSGNSVKPIWSPDSSRILYGGVRRDQLATGELHVFSFDGNKDQRVAANVPIGGDGYCWTRDGGSILVNTNVAGRPARNEPVRVNLATGESQPIFSGSQSFRMRSCSDTLIAAHVGSSIVTRRLQDGTQTELYKLGKQTSNNFGIPMVSHNGQTVAFLATIADQTSALLTVPVTGGTPQELARVKSPVEFQSFLGFAWSPDDRYVYFLKRTDSKSLHELYRVPASGGREESMGLKAMDIRDLDIAPDGRHIAFSIGAAQQREISVLENFVPASR